MLFGLRDRRYDKEIEVNTDVIGFIDPKATINIIKDEQIKSGMIIELED